eukprot:1159646-Pelagomonas_calceolata.AAC.3
MTRSVFRSNVLRILLASLALMAVCHAGRLPSAMHARQARRALSLDGSLSLSPSEPQALEPTIPVPENATTFTTRFENHVGSTKEVILFRLDYNVDVTADGHDDLLVTMGVAPESNAGFEDFVGLAIGNLTARAATIDLTVANITNALMPEADPSLALSKFEPGFLFDYRKITSNNNDIPTPGGKSLSIPINPHGPFDILIGTNRGGQAAHSCAPYRYARLQSTDGGEGSAKTLGAIGEVSDIFQGEGQSYQAEGTIDDVQGMGNHERGERTAAQRELSSVRGGGALCGIICAECKPVDNCVEFNNIPGSIRCPAGNTLASPPMTA